MNREIDHLDSEELHIWLAEAEPTLISALSARCSLRTLPAGFLETEQIDDQDILLLFRATAVAPAFSLTGRRALGRSAKSAGANVWNLSRRQAGENNTQRTALKTTLDTVDKSTRTVGYSAETAINSCISSITGLPSAVDDAGISFDFDGTETRADIAALKNGGVSTCFERPLWEERTIPGLLEPLWQRLDQASYWQYWQEWYLGYLRGAPLPGDLQADITLIPDEHWQQGPAHIARMIEGIREPYRLREQIRNLKAELARQAGAPPPMGHNMPPEELIPEATPAQAVTIIWATVGELEEELQSESPDAARLEGLLGRLRGLGAKAGQFAKDVAYDNAKTIAGGATGAVIATNWPKVAALLDKMAMGLTEWIAYLMWLIG